MKSNSHELKLINMIDVGKTMNRTYRLALSLMMTLALVLLCSRIDDGFIETTQESSTEIKTDDLTVNKTKYTQEIRRIFIPGKKL